MAGQRSKPREDSRTGDTVSGQLSPSRHVSRAVCVSRLCHPQLRESHTEERCSPLHAANMNTGPPEAALGFSWLLVHSHSAVAAVGEGSLCKEAALWGLGVDWRPADLHRRIQPSERLPHGLLGKRDNTFTSPGRINWMLTVRSV